MKVRVWANVVICRDVELDCEPGDDDPDMVDDAIQSWWSDASYEEIGEAAYTSELNLLDYQEVEE